MKAEDSRGMERVEGKTAYSANKLNLYRKWKRYFL